MSGLDMTTFLRVVEEHGPTHVRSTLLDAGYHHAVILAKAEKAARKGYTNYGVCADMCWIEDKGRAFLAGEIR